MENILHINSKDNVVVALSDLAAGTEIVVDGRSITLKDDVPAGHKIALQDFHTGDVVVKYGFPIGSLKEDRAAGSLINEKYIRTLLGEIKDYTYNPAEVHSCKSEGMVYFKGYERKNGDVGIRNEIWIVPTVGCVNGVANELVKLFNEKTAGDKADNFDGIHAYTHNWGCSQLSEDHENTRKILRDSERVKFLECQKVEDEIAAGMEILMGLYENVKKDVRTEQPVSKLRIGLKCGGSDGFSGITANPLLGLFSDRLVSYGGTCVLTEVPEMFGAETILMDRCKDEETFHKTVSLINNFKNYFIKNDQVIYENPSPGNKAGGISTLEEKSLGCTQKSGSSAVIDVLEYGDRISAHGLNLLSAPGNDLVASTALASAGCHMVLFTTGRGTPFGTFVPTAKISTNSNLYNRKTRWMDFNAGVLVEGKSKEEVLDEFFNFVISACSGSYVKNEINNYREISIFKTGVIL